MSFDLSAGTSATLPWKQKQNNTASTEIYLQMLGKLPLKVHKKLRNYTPGESAIHLAPVVQRANNSTQRTKCTPIHLIRWIKLSAAWTTGATPFRSETKHRRGALDNGMRNQITISPNMLRTRSRWPSSFWKTKEQTFLTNNAGVFWLVIWGEEVTRGEWIQCEEKTSRERARELRFPTSSLPSRATDSPSPIPSFPFLAPTTQANLLLKFCSISSFLCSSFYYTHKSGRQCARAMFW